MNTTVTCGHAEALVVLRNGEVVGDPTEGALVVLAERGGIDVTALREEHPRQMEIPFDDTARQRYDDQANAALAAQGLRVLRERRQVEPGDGDGVDPAAGC